MDLFDSNGRRILLEKEHYRGGEGTIHSIAGEPRFFAKLYHKKIDARKQTKLASMTRTADDALLRIAAWPATTLHAGAGGPLIGFVMPRFDGVRFELHQLYTPATRKQTFAKADWAFLLAAARNVAAAIETVHRAGHVIGDVNQRNFIVGQDATVKVLDCDSFQIRNGVHLFLCEVGVPEFTPPELQNRVLAGIERTTNHDAFGLAVLCFQLLFMGRHPFAGRFHGQGEMPIERAIAEGRFAYGRNRRAALMEPPPNMVTFDALPPRLAAMFEAAFGGGKRPTSQDWRSSLEIAQTELRACAFEPMHKYYKALPECSWCRLERASGVYFFIGVLAPRAFDAGRIWAEIVRLTAMPYEPPARPAFQVAPAAAPLGIKTRRRVTVAMKVAGAISFAVGGALFIEWAWLCAALIAVLVILPLPGFAERKRCLAAFQEAERNWFEAYRNAEQEVSVDALVLRRRALEAVKSAYDAVEVEKKKELARLAQNAHKIQLHHYLERHLIRAHPISDIGPKRKATLSAWGIDTAADVTHSALDVVQGFGPALKVRLLAWRAMLESKFVFDPSRAISKQDVDAIEYRCRRRKTDLEQQLRAGADDCRRIRQAILDRRQNVAEELQGPALAWAQAHADLAEINAAMNIRR